LVRGAWFDAKKPIFSKLNQLFTMKVGSRGAGPGSRAVLAYRCVHGCTWSWVNSERLNSFTGGIIATPRKQPQNLADAAARSIAAGAINSAEPPLSRRSSSPSSCGCGPRYCPHFSLAISV
jgi:hypothetical protein